MQTSVSSWGEIERSKEIHVLLYHLHNKILSFFHLPVPFVESPKFAPQRRESARTLAIPHPHPFLRANSDSSMNLPDWMAVPNAPTTNIVSVQVCVGLEISIGMQLKGAEVPNC